MIYFFDTSAIAKRYLREPEMRAVEKCLQEAQSVFVSALSEVELVSAIERSKRESRIDSPTYRRITPLLEKDLAHAPFIILDISSDVRQLAKRLVRQRKLKTLDSLQLATALTLEKRLGETISFVCFDHALADAARLEGLKCPSL